MSYKTLKVQQLNNGTIIRVTLCQPKSLNAMNMPFFIQMAELFKSLNAHQTARVIILEGDGKLFTSGLNLKQMGSIFAMSNKEDSARNAISLYQDINQMQKSFVNLYECRIPVIAGIHKLCIGAGIDLISATDIRYCTKDCIFSIKEIDLGLAADLGTLQFFPKITGNISTFKELTYTGRNFDANEALQVGLVTKIFQNKEELQKGLLQIAKSIASKSPVGINTIKSVTKYQQRGIHDNLQYMRRTNSVMLQTKDTVQAFTAFVEKRVTVFPKL